MKKAMAAHMTGGALHLYYVLVQNRMPVEKKLANASRSRNLNFLLHILFDEIIIIDVHMVCSRASTHTNAYACCVCYVHIKAFLLNHFDRKCKENEEEEHTENLSICHQYKLDCSFLLSPSSSLLSIV